MGIQNVSAGVLAERPTLLNRIDVRLSLCIIEYDLSHVLVHGRTVFNDKDFLKHSQARVTVFITIVRLFLI